MRTERFLLLLTLLSSMVATAGHAAPTRAEETRARQWWNSSSRVCLWVIVDGMRASAVDEDAPWDGPLMPRLQSRRDGCLRFEDLWAELTDPRASRVQLLAGLSPDAAWTLAVDPPNGPPHGEEDGGILPYRGRILRSSGVDAALAALEEAAGSPQPCLVIAELGDLRFPLELSEETLLQLDPQPWADAPTIPVEMEWLEAKRLRPALEAARTGGLESRRPTSRAWELRRWIVSAAHRRLDGELDRLFSRFEAPDLVERGGWILSAPYAHVVAPHGWDLAASSAVIDRIHVPLWMHLPRHVRLTGADRHPHTLRDLPLTLRAWQESRSGVGLFGSGHASRLAFGSAERSPGVRPRGWAQLRWSFEELTVLDHLGPGRRLLVYDRILDPSEFHPRAAATEALEDSLRTELAARFFGTTLTLEISGDLPPGLELDLAAAPSSISTIPNAGAELRAVAGGTRLRWTGTSGAERTLRLRVPVSGAGLRLTREGLASSAVRLGRRTVPLPEGGALRVEVGSPLFVGMATETVADSRATTLRWILDGWWTAP